jgi:hypothetical protein
MAEGLAEAGATVLLRWSEPRNARCGREYLRERGLNTEKVRFDVTAFVVEHSGSAGHADPFGLVFVGASN